MGVRAAVYKAAINHHAYASTYDRSIWYNDQSADLQISLMFKSEDHALSFRSFLELWHLNNPMVIRPGVLHIKKFEDTTFEVDQLSLVLWGDYHPADSESPLQTLQDFPHSHASLDSLSTTISTSDPIAQVQCIEKESEFAFLKPYKCHIKDKAYCETELKQLHCSKW